MAKTIAALAATITLAVVVVASSTATNAGRGWWGRGVVGGFWASATIGVLRARPNYPYIDGYYAPTPVYYSYYAPLPPYPCWRWRHGYRYRVC
jgi:hypothetical protein